MVRMALVSRRSSTCAAVRSPGLLQSQSQSQSQSLLLALARPAVPSRHALRPVWPSDKALGVRRTGSMVESSAHGSNHNGSHGGANSTVHGSSVHGGGAGAEVTAVWTAGAVLAEVSARWAARRRAGLGCGLRLHAA
jgi:hypothetical protein